MYGGSIKCLLRQSTALDGKRQSPRKIQPTHRSGMGFKAIKQNKDGPPFYNEGDEFTRTVFSLHPYETIILAELFSCWYSPAD